MKLLISVVGIWLFTSPLHAELKVEKGCDIPGNNYHHQKAKTDIVCKELCSQDKKCNAFTYISGWGRCNLKSKMKKKFQIEMIAGFIENRVSKEAKISEYFFSSDSTGKDMKSITSLKSHTECGQVCLDNKKCHSFVYIKGYSMCWLKKNKGRIINKVFYCGSK